MRTFKIRFITITSLLFFNINLLSAHVGLDYPNGGETQRIGIVPDIEVIPTIDGIKNGKDELIEKAIAIILKE